MKGNRYIFYTPEEQYPGMPHGEMCGDLMPFYRDGKFILLFLYKYCIYAVETEDFVHYGECRLVLQNGSPEEQDWHAATGSVFYYNDKFYFYYTGFCEGNRGVPGKHEQAILRAVSTDLKTWKKDQDFHFAPDEARFSGEHWRDPQVFWNEEKKKIRMLVTAAEKEGNYMRNGCTAVYMSDDAENWEFYDTVYSPGIFPTHECQDAFLMGGKWYLVFSTYSRQWETRYRMADQFDGPWETPLLDDGFDGREFYAAKTVSNGTKRFLVGWQSIRKDCLDSSPFVWGGNVIVHELAQRSDKTLGVKMPVTIRNSFKKYLPVVLENQLGEWQADKAIRGKCMNGFGWARLGELSGNVLFEGTLAWEEGTHAAGLMIHTAGPNLEKWCQLRIEPYHGRIAVERYDQINGDQMYLDERRIRFDKNEAKVQLIVSGNILLAYVNDTALTTRCYSLQDGGIGLFVECGEVYWRDVELKGGEE